MAFGPEMILAWSDNIETRLEGQRCTGIETGNVWAAFSFAHGYGLLCSLHQAYYGSCRIEREELDNLREAGQKMPRAGEMLKKHIAGARLVSAEQVGRDRILRLSFDKALGAGFRRRFNVIFEFMAHRSNMFITDEEDRILDAFRPIHPEQERPRTAVPGAVYTPPPPVRGKTVEELLQDLSFDRPVAGLGKDLSAALASASTTWPPETLKASISAFLTPNLTGTMRFQWLNRTLTLFPELLPGGIPLQEQEALDAARMAVAKPLLAEATHRGKKKLIDILRKELKDAQAKQNGLESRKMDAVEAWKWKRAGEMLLAWQHSVPERAREVELTDWESDPPEQVKIGLDPDLSPVENARAFFRLFKKKKKHASSVDRDLRRLASRIESLLNMALEVESLTDPKSVRRFAEETGLSRPAGGNRGRKELAYRRFDLDGAMVLVGRNERGNRHVTFDLARGTDIWLHARDVPGSHVLLRRLDGKETSFSPDDGRLLFAASLAAYYSRNRSAGKVLVDYTEKKHVAAQKGAVADVTYSHGRSINVSPLLWKDLSEETP